MVAGQYTAQSYYWLIIIIAGRFYGSMAICPLFADNIMPKMLKMIISLMMSIIISPYFAANITQNNIAINLLLLLNNLIVGAILGYIFSFPFWLIENIANFIDLQRGEQFGAVINHTTQNPASSLSKLLLQGFMAYFVTINGIIYFINGIFFSFHHFPYSKFIFNYTIPADIYIDFFSKYFYWLVILALPVIFIMFLLDLALGLLNTFIQQFNVTVLAMPIKSALALIVLILYIGVLYHAITFEFLADKWSKFL